MVLEKEGILISGKSLLCSLIYYDSVIILSYFKE